MGLEKARASWGVADRPAVYRLTGERRTAQYSPHSVWLASWHRVTARLLAGHLLDTNSLLRDVID